jgi:hypothetical protein
MRYWNLSQMVDFQYCTEWIMKDTHLLGETVCLTSHRGIS